MTDITQGPLFAEGKDQHPLLAKLGALSPQELEMRRREIVAQANGDHESMSVDHLEELAFIVSTLRRRSAGPPKTVAAKTPKAKPTIDSLL